MEQNLKNLYKELIFKIYESKDNNLEIIDSLIFSKRMFFYEYLIEEQILSEEFDDLLNHNYIYTQIENYIDKIKIKKMLKELE